jgi:hypothetical protein
MGTLYVYVLVCVFCSLVCSETESTWYVGHYLACCTGHGRWMMMRVEQSVYWLERETQLLGENLQFHFVHFNSHITWPGLEPGPP